MNKNSYNNKEKNFKKKIVTLKGKFKDSEGKTIHFSHDHDKRLLVFSDSENS